MRNSIVVMFALLLPYVAGAKELYVSPNGDDSVPYDTNRPAKPWATIGRGSASWATTCEGSVHSEWRHQRLSRQALSSDTTSSCGAKYGSTYKCRAHLPSRKRVGMQAARDAFDGFTGGERKAKHGTRTRRSMARRLPTSHRNRGPL